MNTRGWKGREMAFISILVFGIESFPSKFKGSRKPKGTTYEDEVYGLLFGQRIEKNGDKIFNVTIAIPMQMLESRSPLEVMPSTRPLNEFKPSSNPIRCSSFRLFS